MMPETAIGWWAVVKMPPPQVCFPTIKKLRQHCVPCRVLVGILRIKYVDTSTSIIVFLSVQFSAVKQCGPSYQGSHLGVRLSFSIYILSI